MQKAPGATPESISQWTPRASVRIPETRPSSAACAGVARRAAINSGTTATHASQGTRQIEKASGSASPVRTARPRRRARVEPDAVTENLRSRASELLDVEPGVENRREGENAIHVPDRTGLHVLLQLRQLEYGAGVETEAGHDPRDEQGHGHRLDLR